MATPPDKGTVTTAGWMVLPPRSEVAINGIDHAVVAMRTWSDKGDETFEFLMEDGTRCSFARDYDGELLYPARYVRLQFGKEPTP